MHDGCHFIAVETAMVIFITISNDTIEYNWKQFVRQNIIPYERVGGI